MNSPIIYFILLLKFLNFICCSSNVSCTYEQKRWPKAIIIGVRKCGTRALLEFLRLNPLIKAPGPEVHFFNRNFIKGIEWYRSQMPIANCTDMILEKTPAYFIDRNAPERVYKFDKNMKLVVVVRNPVIRAISDYTQALSKRQRRSTLQSFEEMATNSTTRSLTGKKYVVNASWNAIKIGIYHRYVRRWLKFFPLKQIHFLDGEQLITNPAAEIRAVEKFLDVKPTARRRNFVTDPIKGFPCVSRLNNTIHCLGKTKGRVHPGVSANVLKSLHNFYEPENEKLFKLISKRFVWSGFA